MGADRWQEGSNTRVLQLDQVPELERDAGPEDDFSVTIDNLMYTDNLMLEGYIFCNICNLQRYDRHAA